ncbi:MAG TPA: hypothetical protein VH079_16460 [Terriglobales bacterium]|jgi:hypothetical protein|nr:hypothetical protein [Terriglobales bacterium]
MAKPTAADAQVILKLYNLRRDAEMRKARAWWLGEFWPKSVEDFTKVSAAMGTQENNWLRQVSGYWEMAASLAVHGAVSSDLFLEPSFSGEMFFLFAKVNPFLKELREKISPTMLRNVEQLIKSTKSSREFFKRTEVNVANRLKSMAK